MRKISFIFLCLCNRFQAVECFLANVKSTLQNDPETWDQQSIEAFEEYTQGN